MVEDAGPGARPCRLRTPTGGACAGRPPRHRHGADPHPAADRGAGPAERGARHRKAGEVHENLKVLGDLSVAEFGRTMRAITAWVSPEQGCLHCHEQGNFASDTTHTKVVRTRSIRLDTRSTRPPRRATTAWPSRLKSPVPSGARAT
ncbi:MAG: photosynthetic reaction center cytochrome c subunit family protein [Rubrivivax sp.]